MTDPSLNQLLLLALTWAAWAGLHSLLLWEPLRGRLQKTLGWSGTFYRACYSGLALATIVLVCWYASSLGAFYSIFWPWPWLLIQVALWTIATVIMLWAWLSFKKGGVDLMGWEDAATHHYEPPHLVTGGAYGWSRHPMYLASGIVLWTRALTPADLITNAVLTIYLVLGSWHEERRMQRAFGNEWDEYADKVPIFIKWRPSG
jgi:methanethiol S-methyltransferase